jgi:molecular chaperone DnaK
MATDNKSLGRFILDGIPPAPRGLPQVEVTFDVDANGILNVKAKEKTSGKEQSIRIEASSGLTDEDIKRMQAEAEAHAEEDKKKQELVETRNLADSLIHTAEKSLKDAAGKIGDDIKTSVETAIANLKAKKDTGTKEEIEGLSEALSTEMQKIGQAMSQNQSAGDAPAQDAPKE